MLWVCIGNGVAAKFPAALASRQPPLQFVYDEVKSLEMIVSGFLGLLERRLSVLHCFTLRLKIAHGHRPLKGGSRLRSSNLPVNPFLAFNLQYC